MRLLRLRAVLSALLGAIGTFLLLNGLSGLAIAIVAVP